VAVRVGIQVEGLKPLLRAFKQLEDEAQDEMKQSARELAEELAGLMRAAGKSLGKPRQAAAAANTVEVFQGTRLPNIRAGRGSRSGSQRDKDVTFGSEFGATRRFGWYSKGRYYDSVGKQFRPHRGAASYWFFKTAEENDERIGSKYAEALDRMADKWGRG
jgi:hypothetical protein